VASADGNSGVIMSGDAFLDRVLKVVSRTAGPARTPADAGADTLLGNGGFWLDSVDLVELVVACETEFAVRFEGETDLTEETLSSVRTLADLIRTKSPR
jgi:acyl carrier protein